MDDSRHSSTDTARGESLFSATSKNSGIYFQRGAVKYGRPWGCQVGFKNKPGDTRDERWLHGVCGLEFNWSTYASGGNISDCADFMLIYGSRYSSVYGMPVIQNKNLWPGATKNHSGDNLLSISKVNNDGRISIRGASDMCNWIHKERLIFLGFAIGFKQRGNQTIGETQQFRMWNCRPMFSRNGLDQKYRAICPGKAYPFSQAIDGYMAIA